MTAPLHESLADAASKANQNEWHLRIGDEWSKSIVTFHGEMENGEPSVWTLIDVNLRRDEAEETLRYLHACQPANVAKLCEQVRVMKEALEQVKGVLAWATQDECLEPARMRPREAIEVASAALKLVDEQ